MAIADISHLTDDLEDEEVALTLKVDDLAALAAALGMSLNPSAGELWKQRAPHDVRALLLVDLIVIYSNVVDPKYPFCQRCDGRGVLEKPPAIECPDCKGSGGAAIERER